MSNLDDYFRVMGGVDRQRQMTGNPAAGLTAQNAALSNMGYQVMQEAKQNKGLALQERQVATGERAQAAQASQFGQQMSLYNKALDQQKQMGYLGLGAQALGAAGTLWAASDRTDMMKQIYGRGGSQALTSAPATSPGVWNNYVSAPSPDLNYVSKPLGGSPDRQALEWKPEMGGADVSKSSTMGDLFAPGGALSWANFWD